MADNNTIARPYAEAAFEVASENQALAEFSEALAAAKALMTDGQVAAFLSRPALSDEERLAFLQGLFAQMPGGESVFGGGSQHGTNFLKLLIENGRVGVLPEIAEHFEDLRAGVENTVDVVVTSAAGLSDEQRQDIVAALTQRLGRDVRLDGLTNALIN
jgi:F-type H+-transporting ATPase subunit delta